MSQSKSLIFITIYKIKFIIKILNANTRMILYLRLLFIKVRRKRNVCFVPRGFHAQEASGSIFGAKNFQLCRD